MPSESKEVRNRHSGRYSLSRINYYFICRQTATRHTNGGRQRNTLWKGNTLPTSLGRLFREYFWQTVFRSPWTPGSASVSYYLYRSVVFIRDVSFLGMLYHFMITSLWDRRIELRFSYIISSLVRRFALVFCIAQQRTKSGFQTNITTAKIALFIRKNNKKRQRLWYSALMLFILAKLWNCRRNGYYIQTMIALKSLRKS